MSRSADGSLKLPPPSLQVRMPAPLPREPGAALISEVLDGTTAAEGAGGRDAGRGGGGGGGGGSGGGYEYALLVPTGLEAVASRALPPGPYTLTLPHVSGAAAPQGSGSGGGGGGGSSAAGGVSPMLARSEHPLPADVLASPCLSAALALIAHDEHVPDAALRSAGALSAWLLGGGSAGAAEDAGEGGRASQDRTDRVEGALSTLGAHRGAGAAAPRTFRVATLRGGEHAAFGSRDIDRALGRMVGERRPQWSAHLGAPDVLFLCLLAGRRATLGVLLPPFAPRRSDVLPHEPRVWFEAGRERPHTRPSRAALLVRLAHLAPYERLIDPCGGVGVLALEGRVVHGASRVRLDGRRRRRVRSRGTQRAARAARAADSDAPLALSPGSTVCVVAGDALRCPFANGSFDVAVADLPFGMRHAKLDVGALMRELARVLTPRGGRALLFGSAGGGGGSADAVIKVAKVHQPNVWDVVERTRCSAAGVACEAVLLKLGEGGGATSTSTSTDLQF